MDLIRFCAAFGKKETTACQSWLTQISHWPRSLVLTD